MSDLLVRDIAPATVDSLRRRARRDRRSLEAETRTVLVDAAERPTRSEAIARINAIYERLSAGGRVYSDSTEMIREGRDSR